MTKKQHKNGQRVEVRLDEGRLQGPQAARNHWIRPDEPWSPGKSSLQGRQGHDVDRDTRPCMAPKTDIQWSNKTDIQMLKLVQLAWTLPSLEGAEPRDPVALAANPPMHQPP